MSDRTFILIISYGRTGSTLLRELLNTDPKANFQGENDGCFIALSNFYQRVISSAKVNNADSTSPWFSKTDIDLVKKNLYPVIEEGFFGDLKESQRVIGFKDVIYKDLTQETTKSLFYMLNEMYNFKVLFNFRRNKVELVNSMIRATMIGGTLGNAADKFDLVEGLEDNCAYPNFRIDYEDLLSPDKLQELFTFCGLNYDEEKCEALSKIPHSQNHKPGRFD